MADGNVRLRASASFSQLENELAKTQTQLQKKEQRIQQMTNAYGRMETKGTTAFGKLLRNAITVASTYASIHSLINQVTQAFRQQAELELQGGDTVKRVAEAQRALGVQTIGFSDLQKFQLRQGVGAASGGVLTEEEQLRFAAPLLGGTAGAVSQRIQQVTEAVELLAPLAQAGAASATEIGTFGKQLLVAQTNTGISLDRLADLTAAGIGQSTTALLSEGGPMIEALSANTAQIKEFARSRGEEVDIESLIKDQFARFAGLSAVSGASEEIVRTIGVKSQQALIKVAKETGLPLNEVVRRLETGDQVMRELFAGESFGKAIGQALGPAVFDPNSELNQKIKEIRSELDNTAGAFAQVRQEALKGTPEIALATTLKQAQVASEQRIKETVGVSGIFRELVLDERRGLLSAVEDKALRRRATSLGAQLQFMPQREAVGEFTGLLRAIGVSQGLRFGEGLDVQRADVTMEQLMGIEDRSERMRRFFEGPRPLEEAELSSRQKFLVDILERIEAGLTDFAAAQQKETELRRQMQEKSNEDLRNTLQGAVNAAGPREGPE